MKNIILLISDTYRWDNLYDRAKRPVRTHNLDRFADTRAVEMLNFYTGSFPTIPHRTDVITGRLGWPRYGWQDLKLSSRNALPMMLNEQGYATQLICDCPHVFNTGFQHVFQAAYHTRGQEGDCHLLHLNDKVVEAVPDTKARHNNRFMGRNIASKHRWTNRYFTCEEETFNYRTASTTVRWLEENNRANPFFLWVDFFDPHEPWDPPEYLVKHYQEEYSGIPMIQPNYGLASDYTEEELVNLWAHYAAEAEMVDRSLGRVLQKIDDLQLWDDSVVVMTSDHGFAIGERNRTAKSNINDRDPRHCPIYPEISHVPFLIACQGLKGGEKMNAIAQPEDILPTVTELAGVSVDPPEPIEGRSFVKVLTGETDVYRATAVAADCRNISKPLPKGKTMTPFITDSKWGYTPVGPEGQEELFDMSEDLLNETNCAADNPEKVKEMKELFRAHVKEYEGAEPYADFWLDRK